MVCVECVEVGPLYSALRSVPAKTIHGNTKNRLQEDQHRLPSKMHLDGSQGRFGRTHGSTGPTLAASATAFLWVTAWWALMLVHRCRGLVSRFALVCGPLLHVLRRTRSSTTSSAYSSCFLILDLCSWEHKSSKTTMELG